MGWVESYGPSRGDDTCGSVTGEELGDGESLPGVGIVGLEANEEAVDALGIAGESNIEEESPEIGEVVGVEIDGLFAESSEIMAEEASCFCSAIASEEEFGEASADFGVGRVELEHSAEAGDGIVGAVLAVGEIGEEEMGLGMIALDFEDASELFAGLGEAVHVDEEAAEVEDGVGVARIVSELAEKELACSFRASGLGVCKGEACVDARESGIE